MIKFVPTLITLVPIFMFWKVPYCEIQYAKRLQFPIIIQLTISEVHVFMDSLLMSIHQIHVSKVYYLSHVTGKSVFRFSNQILHHSSCTATEDGWRLEIYDLGSRGIVHVYYLCSENKGTDLLHCYHADRLRGYHAAGLRLFFAYAKSRFSYDTTHFFPAVWTPHKSVYRLAEPINNSPILFCLTSQTLFGLSVKLSKHKVLNLANTSPFQLFLKMLTFLHSTNEPRHENRIFAYVKTKMQISFAVTAKLISAFVFAIRIVKSRYYLNPKFKPLAIFCDCTARFVWDLVGNREDRFSQNEAQMVLQVSSFISEE